MANQTARKRLAPAVRLAAGILRPAPRRTPDEWADQSRILPPGSAEPGPWRSSRTPYLVPVMQACVDPRYRRVVLACGAQMGKTESVLNVVGHRLDDHPAPVLYVGPTQKQAESMSADRVAKMLRSTPSLWAKTARGHAFKTGEKHINGARLGFAWAGSPTELASHPAALVLVDERDRMLDTAEGDPVELAEARTSTYIDGKVIIVSTPTVEGASPVWKLWEEGTRFEWSWPCPECGQYFVPRFELLKWPEKATPAVALREAKLACPHCGTLIDDAHRAAMNDAGVFAAPGQTVSPEGEVLGDPPDTDTASFWVSGLASPWRSWGQRAKAFLAATRSGEPGRVQGVVNTALGELYRVAGDAPPWEGVLDLRESYVSGTVPDGAQVLTAGVDVQKDRLVYCVRGWGAGYESWLVQHGELWGETAGAQVWQELVHLLDTPFDGHPVRLALIDSGYRPGDPDSPTNVVYEFCRRHAGRVLPSKGHDSQAKPVHVAPLDETVRGRTVGRGLKLVHVDADYCKQFVYGRLQRPKGEPGAWHLPADVGEPYAQELTAEARVVKSSGRAAWVRIRRANHVLDCEALNVAAAHLLNLHLLRPGRGQAPAVPAPDAPQPPAPRAPVPRGPGGWIGRSRGAWGGRAGFFK